MKKFSIALVLFLFSLKGFSTHIVGGEIFYDYLGGNNYRITLKLYRDCFNGLAPYDNPASIGVFDVNGNLVQNLFLNFPGSVQVPYSINNACITAPTNICVEEAVYDTIVNLAPIAGGYDITYQRCCRNNTILNLTNPQDVGATYTAHIPDVSIVPINSSPRFNNFPPIFLCVNYPVNFDHSAIDPDGDMLVYEFADPYDGASSVNPMPQPPAALPYVTVPWLPPYNGQYPMSSSPAMAVNNTTGMLTGAPNMIGQWVVGVRVKEYRNNQLLSINMRDFQFNVVNCPPVPVSSIPSQTIYCFGMTVNFQNNSVNGTTWHWDFGDPLAVNDTSNQFTPSWTYSQSGTYNVMLIANPGTQCADTGFTTFYIYPLLNPSFVAPPAQCLQGNSFNFTAGGAFGGGPGAPTFSWQFGANATPDSSNLQNVSNVTYSAAGVYLVTLTVSENGCTMTYIDTVIVLDETPLTYNAPPVEGCAPVTVQFSDTSFSDPSVIQVLWDFGDGNFSSQNNPVHVYTQPGVYTVTVNISTNNFCIGNFTFTVSNMVTVFPSPSAGMSANPTTITVSDPIVTFTDLSSGASSCWIYFGDGDSSNNCGGTHTYYASGTYTVMQVVENQYGCKDYAYLEIDANLDPIFWIPNTFTPNGDDVNEFFAPVAMGIEDFHFMIFDRWGNLIFESKDLAKGWDGTVKPPNGIGTGKIAQEDVYVWKVEFKNAGKRKVLHKYVGHVSLVK